MEVPLENQTKESLIAYIRSLESQSEIDEKRMAALEELFLSAEDLDGTDEAWNRLYAALKACRETSADALTRTPQDKEQ